MLNYISQTVDLLLTIEQQNFFGIDGRNEKRFSKVKVNLQKTKLMVREKIL